MARFYTEDEIRRFETNPYVINATDRFINFTAEFKQIFYSRYKETRKPKRILESLGFDIELLSYARIHCAYQLPKRLHIQGLSTENGYISLHLKLAFNPKNARTMWCKARSSSYNYDPNSHKCKTTRSATSKFGRSLFALHPSTARGSSKCFIKRDGYCDLSSPHGIRLLLAYDK